MSTDLETVKAMLVDAFKRFSDDETEWGDKCFVWEANPEKQHFDHDEEDRLDRLQEHRDHLNTFAAAVLAFIEAREAEKRTIKASTLTGSSVLSGTITSLTCGKVSDIGAPAFDNRPHDGRDGDSE